MKIVGQKEVNMSSGPIWKHIVGFSVPLLIGLLFQQLYNTVDSIVVGNFVGKEALAAVGSTTSIINTLIGVFAGFSTGAGVVISQSFGAGDDIRVSKAVHTTMTFMLLLSVVFTVAGILMVDPMLKLMSTPDDVYNEAKSYLTIYFAGIMGLVIYNTGSGVLRAVGDSQRPLYFLIFSAVLNTGLDLLFVIAFKMGVAGVALATVISQCLSAALIIFVLMRSDASYKLELRNMGISMDTLKNVLRVGLPTSIQSGLTSFSNVFVQSYINSFGSACMAGWSAYVKVDSFAAVPANATSMAVTTFVGQNVGAKENKRAERGIYVTLGLTVAVTLAIMVPLMIFARPLTALFNKDAEVLLYGVRFVRLMMPFYVLCSVFNTYAGALRGAGDATAPMLIMLSSFVLFRQIYLYAVSRLVGTVSAIALGYPVGWFLASLFLFIYYMVRGRKYLLRT